MKKIILSFSSIPLFLLALNARAAVEFIFAPLVQNECSVHSLQPLAQLQLNRYFETARYDRIVYYTVPKTKLSVSEHSEDPELYKFDSLQILKEKGSANCVGVSKFFIENLNASTHANFQLIAATSPSRSMQPGLPTYAHAALVAWCRDGYLLVDPSLNISRAIPLQEGRDFVHDVNAAKRMTFHLDSESKRIHVHADSADSAVIWDDVRRKSEEYHYRLEELLNPDDAITSVFFAYDKKLLAFSYSNPHESSFRITLNLAKAQVEYTETESTGKVTPHFTVSFDDYSKNPAKLLDCLDDSVAKNLRMDRDLFLTEIKTALSEILK